MSKMKSSNLTPLTVKAPEKSLNAPKDAVVKALSNHQGSLITVEGEVKAKPQSKPNIYHLDFDGIAIGIAELYK